MGVIHRDQGAYDIAQAYFFKSIDLKNNGGKMSLNRGLSLLPANTSAICILKKETLIVR